MKNKNIILTSPLAGGARRTGKSEGYIKEKSYFTPSSVCSDFVRQTTSPTQGGSQTTGGFTLIELLVVVLIIGILAAVALPQYTLAVNKTRFANLRSTANALAKASEVYFLANGTWASNFDELTVDLPAGMNVSTVSDGTCGVNNEMYCCIIPSSSGYAPAISCGRNDYTFIFHTVSNRTSPEWLSYCVAKQDDKNATQLCKALGTPRASWLAFTSEGRDQSGYMYYTLNR